MIEAERDAHKSGMRSAVMTTVSKANAHELPGIIDLAMQCWKEMS
jgi:hypothetical protein